MGQTGLTAGTTGQQHYEAPTLSWEQLVLYHSQLSYFQRGAEGNRSFLSLPRLLYIWKKAEAKI